MINIINVILELIGLFFKNISEKKAEVREKNERLCKEATDAILSRDPSKLTNALDKLRRK